MQNMDFARLFSCSIPSFTGPIIRKKSVPEKNRVFPKDEIGKNVQE
jgi:hypothetical protein